MAEEYKAEVHWRSEENCRDNIHAVHTIIECLDFYEKLGIIIENVGMLLPTSPLRRYDDIDSAFGLLKDSGLDSVVGVSSFGKPASSLRYLNEMGLMSPIIETESFEVNRQYMAQTLFEVNGAIFVARVEHLKKTKSFHQGKVMAYHMARDRSVDINTLSDWTIAEAILICQNQK